MALHVSADGLLSVHDKEDSKCPPTPEDQDEGEGAFHLLPKSSPRLPRRSSNDDLEAGSGTEPTSPLIPTSPSIGSPRRRVSFADNFGLELTAVKFYDEAEVPDVPEAILDPLRDETDDDVMRRLTLRFRSCDVMNATTNSTSPISPPSTCKGHLFLKPNFDVPSSRSDLLAEVRANQVALESVAVEEEDPLCVRILMRVHNICYQKTVFVRRTFDGWASFYDLLAEYVLDSNDGATDQFAFRLSLPPPLALEGTAMEFAVRFETPFGSFWANNGQTNYSLVCCWADDVDGIGAAATPAAEEESADKNLRSCLKTKSWEPSPETLQAEAIADGTEIKTCKDMKVNDLGNSDPLHPSNLKPSSSMENFVPLQLMVTSPTGEEKVLGGGNENNRELRLQVGGQEGTHAESPADTGEIKKLEKRSRFSRNKRIAALCKKMKDEGGMHPFCHISLDDVEGNDNTDDSSSEATSPAANFEADSENNNVLDNAGSMMHRDADSRNDNLATSKDAADVVEPSADADQNEDPDRATRNETGTAQRRVELAKMTEVEVSTVQTVVRSELPVATKLDDDRSRVLVQNDEEVGGEAAAASGDGPSSSSERGAEGSAEGLMSTSRQEPATDFNMNMPTDGDAAFESVVVVPPLAARRPSENAYSHYESYEDLRIGGGSETTANPGECVDDSPTSLGVDEGWDVEGNRAAGADLPGTTAPGGSEKDVQLNYSKDDANEALEAQADLDVCDEPPQAPVNVDDHVAAAAAERAAVTECDVSVQTEDASLYEEVLPEDLKGSEYLTEVPSMPLQAFEIANVSYSTRLHERRAPTEHSECELDAADAVVQHADEALVDFSRNSNELQHDSISYVHVGGQLEESLCPEEPVGMDISCDDVQFGEELPAPRAYVLSKEAALGEYESVQEMHETSDDDSRTPTNVSQEHSPEVCQGNEMAKGHTETHLNPVSEDSWGDYEIVEETPAVESSTEGVLLESSDGKARAAPGAETVGGFSCTPSDAAPLGHEHAGAAEAAEEWETAVKQTLSIQETPWVADRPPLQKEPWVGGGVTQGVIVKSSPVSAKELDEGSECVPARGMHADREHEVPTEGLAGIAYPVDKQVQELLESSEMICSEPRPPESSEMICSEPRPLESSEIICSEPRLLDSSEMICSEPRLLESSEMICSEPRLLESSEMICSEPRLLESSEIICSEMICSEPLLVESSEIICSEMICSEPLLVESSEMICSEMICSEPLLVESSEICSEMICSEPLLVESSEIICSEPLLVESSEMICSEMICSEPLLVESSESICSEMICSEPLLVESSEIICSEPLLVESSEIICSEPLLVESSEMICSEMICSEPLLVESSESICSEMICSEPLLVESSEICSEMICSEPLLVESSEIICSEPLLESSEMSCSEIICSEPLLESSEMICSDMICSKSRLVETSEMIFSEPHVQLQDDPLFAAVPPKPSQKDVSIARDAVETVTDLVPNVEDNQCILQTAVLEQLKLVSLSNAEEEDNALDPFLKAANQTLCITEASPLPHQPIGDVVKVQKTTDIEQNFSVQETRPVAQEYPSYDFALQATVTESLPMSSTPRVRHVHHKDTEEHENHPTDVLREELQQQEEEQEEVDVQTANVLVKKKTQISHLGEESVKRYFESGDAEAHFPVAASDFNLQYEEVPLSEFMSDAAGLGEASPCEINEEVSVASVIVEPGSCNLSDVEDDTELDQDVEEAPDLEHYMEQFKPNHDFSDVTSNIQAIQEALLGAIRPLVDLPDSEEIEAVSSLVEPQLRDRGFESTEVTVWNRPFLEKFSAVESYVMTEQPGQLGETPDLTPEIKYQHELEFPKAPNQTQWFPKTSAVPNERVDEPKFKETSFIEKTPPVERTHSLEEHWAADSSVTDDPAAGNGTQHDLTRREYVEDDEQTSICETHVLLAEGTDNIDALAEPIITQEQLNRIVGMVEENVRRFLEANAGTLQASADDAGLAERCLPEGEEDGAGPCAQPEGGEMVPTAQLEDALGDELAEETNFESSAFKPPLKLNDFETPSDALAASSCTRVTRDLEASADVVQPARLLLTSVAPAISTDDGAVTPELESVDQWLLETPPLSRRRPASRINEGRLDEDAVPQSPVEQHLTEEVKRVGEDVPAAGKRDEDVWDNDEDDGVDLRFENQELDKDLEPRVAYEELNKDVDSFEEDKEKQYPERNVVDLQLEEEKADLKREQGVSTGTIFLHSDPQVQLESGSVSGSVLAEPEVEVLPVCDEIEAVGVKRYVVEAGCDYILNVQDTVTDESLFEEAQVSQRPLNELPMSKREIYDLATKVDLDSACDPSKSFGEEEQLRETRLLTEVGEIRDILQSMLVEVNQPVERFTLRDSAEGKDALASIIEECGETKEIVGHALRGIADAGPEEGEEPRATEGSPPLEGDRHSSRQSRPDSSHAAQGLGDPEGCPGAATDGGGGDESAEQPVPDANKARPKPRRPRPAFPTIIVNEVIPEEDESRAFVEDDDSPPGASGWDHVAAEPSGGGEVRPRRGWAVSATAVADASPSYKRLQQVFEKVLYFLAFVVFLVALYHYDIVVCCALYVVSLGVLYYENEITESGHRQYQPGE
uniref:Uncharacterized protein LOC116949417 isoform X4 n=1 Tax=Petromyzon marinus TaxID=7757 RepID=A0AAJ7TTB9_PETMA|nr:uncharacterized protein LOC116949417 isoform X4 [Petromyzon marinus]